MRQRHIIFFWACAKEMWAVSILDACQAAAVCFGRRAWLSNIAAIVSNQREKSTDTADSKKSFFLVSFCGPTIVELEKNKTKQNKSLCRPDA